ncbi:hypothetical protein Slin15195_G124050 [Septoria linicola]|uniref:Uncharacterized protein n=1 Tax=Septoria linicola TaxID=215465 RepID=A0A9Q9EPS8_9PEZI|nr:hypothetical protein Slin14017_G080250 [Septoria linicola]USW59086.1 hypothetical protein Slin15195_G124050 [Septoria linicola]
MQYLFALFASLSIVSALSDNKLDVYGHPGMGSTSIASSSTITSSVGSSFVPYPVFRSSRLVIPRPHPTDYAPNYSHLSNSTWPHPTPTPIGHEHEQQSSSSNATLPTGFTTRTTALPITTTITRHVPCSTQISSNGQTWWSTYLTTSYHITSYTTTKTSIVPIPTGKPAPVHDKCPQQATVTQTITEFISPPSPASDKPSAHLTTKTLTLTLDHDHTTTITVSYTMPTTAT